MKKLLSLAAAFLLCAGVQAQIVSSRSVSIKSAQKQPSETQWFLRGGLNVMKMTGDGAEDTGSKDRKSTRLNSSHRSQSRMPSSA